MRRTQLYLDDQLWNALHIRARDEKTTVSDLVRIAIRDRYLGQHDERLKAMRDFVGSGRKRAEHSDAVAYIRDLRRGDRRIHLSGNTNGK